MPCDSTPRIVARLIASPPGSVAPTSAHGAVHAGRGVRRAADDLQAARRADVDLAHAQPVGVRMRRDRCRCAPTTTPANGGAAGATSSTSRPAIVSVSHSAALSSGGSHSVRSQCSENFIALGELAQEAQVVLEEQAQVVDAVAQHRQPVEPHAEREALVALGIDADVRAARSDAPGPSPAISSQPPSPNAMSISADGSVNGKNDGRKRTLRSSRSKKRAGTR